MAATILLLCYGFLLYSQHDCRNLMAETRIDFVKELKSHRHEYSSLARYKIGNRSYLLIVPQKPKDTVYGISETDIQKAIAEKRKKKPNAPLRSTGKFHFDSQLTDFGLKNYDGVEGTAITGNTIFFAVETGADNDCGYVVKGRITPGISGNYRITLINKKEVPKPPDFKKKGNAGYESILLTKEGKLLVMFEKNRYKNDASVYLLDTGFQSNPEPIHLASPKGKPLLFRITDAALQNNASDTVLAINHHYAKSESELEFYVGKENKYTAKEYLQKKDPHSFHFTQIVRLVLETGNVLRWVVNNETIIGYCVDNWGGLIPFRYQNEDGILMVVDGEPGGYDCKLAYFKLR